MKNKYRIILSLVIAVIFILGFTPLLNPPPSGWYQQFMPNLNGRSIQDVFFLDSLTGWAVTNATNQQYDTTYILKTSNSGDDWFIQYKRLQAGGGYSGLFKIYFINQSTGFICGVTGIDKSIDGGNNWTTMNAPNDAYLDMSVLNKDTIRIVSANGITGGVYFTSNSGANWQQQFSGATSHIYMFNARIGFMDGNNELKKTTNGGVTWFGIANEGVFFDMFFIDSLTGWKCNGFVKKTTNGGINWFYQTLPSGNFLGQGVVKFMNNDNDTIWSVGESLITGGTPSTRGILFRTTNGGNNWLFQLPDTSIHIVGYWLGKIINNKYGWAYHFTQGGIHTSTGGNNIFFTGINNNSNTIPNHYVLYQNYPNPFNPVTVIRYEIKKDAFIQLRVFDIQGKETSNLINQIQIAGKYSVDFNANNLSSGIYFYSLFIDNKLIDTKKMILLK